MTGLFPPYALKFQPTLLLYQKIPSVYCILTFRESFTRLRRYSPLLTNISAQRKQTDRTVRLVQIEVSCAKIWIFEAQKLLKHNALLLLCKLLYDFSSGYNVVLGHQKTFGAKEHHATTPNNKWTKKMIFSRNVVSDIVIPEANRTPNNYTTLFHQTTQVNFCWRAIVWRTTVDEIFHGSLDDPRKIPWDYVPATVFQLHRTLLETVNFLPKIWRHVQSECGFETLENVLQERKKWVQTFSATQHESETTSSFLQHHGPRRVLPAIRVVAPF